jgi:1-deoxy-D-xylulose-5-phosphate synthase
VAVLGDAAAGCGLALEALNNIASTTGRMIVVLNDNEMSIDKNVGAISRYLGGLLANPHYNRWKASVERAAERMRMGWLRSVYYRTEEAVKSLFLRSVMFEELGLRYVGPIDGHDMQALLDAFSIARESKKPIIVHVSTVKGKGYPFAEVNPGKWHGTSGFEVATGKGLSAAPAAATYSERFGDALMALAERDQRIVAITAAMAGGTGLTAFANRFPDRFFDVGIAEGHGATFAAGLAAQGKLPVFAVYSTFLQRAVDNVIHDICLQNLPVVLCLDRAGVVGDDGPTHHGVFDIPLLRSIPNLVYMQPRHGDELRRMLALAFALGRPVAIRYPRGACPEALETLSAPGATAALQPGKAEVLREGEAVQIWALGDMVPAALETAERLAGDGLSVGVVSARFIRPLDRELLMRLSRAACVTATMENGVLAGGFGSAVEEALSEVGILSRVVRFGWPDMFVPQGPAARLRATCGLEPEQMAERIRQALARPPDGWSSASADVRVCSVAGKGGHAE